MQKNWFLHNSLKRAGFAQAKTFVLVFSLKRVILAQAKKPQRIPGAFSLKRIPFAQAKLAQKVTGGFSLKRVGDSLKRQLLAQANLDQETGESLCLDFA